MQAERLRYNGGSITGTYSLFAALSFMNKSLLQGTALQKPGTLTRGMNPRQRGLAFINVTTGRPGYFAQG